MLGRLQMDIDTCIKKYCELSGAAFQPKRAKGNVLGKVKDIWNTRGKYSSTRLASEIQTIVESVEGDAHAKFMNSNAACKTGQPFVDGATGLNNPVEVVVEEAKSIWTNAISRIQCIVSIGTGVLNFKKFGDDVKEVVETLIAISTETEDTERRFLQSHESLGLSGRYFRYNVDKGLGEIGLDEHNGVNWIIRATESYLEEPRLEKTIKDFVTAHDPSIYTIILLARAVSNLTGNWFLEGEFDKWGTQHHSFLWLYGKAGCGKTVLSSTIIHKISSKIREEGLGVLAYYYISFRDKESQEVYPLVCSLLTQLVRGLVREVRPGQYYLPTAFRNLYDNYQPASEPTMEDLIATFQGVSGESKKIYIVIDALDECPLQRDREDIIKFLKEFSLCVQSSMHILITSREEKDIRDTINEVLEEKCHRVSIQNVRVNDDIRVYLQTSMAEDSVFRKWPCQVQDKVIEHLMEKANGVFRYVQCQLITLRECLRPKDIEKALNELPKDLDETYSRMLSQIRERYVDTAYTIIQWLAFSGRPLKLSEAAEVVVFTEGPSLDCERYPVSVDPTNRFDPQHVPAILSGLVIMSGLDGRVNTGREEVITFAHFSVKEYLECNRVEPKRFRLLGSAAHWFILKSCLAYIHRYDNQPSKEAGSEQLPLLLYACKYWPHHAIALYRCEDQAVGRMAELLTIHKGPTLILSARVALGLNNHQFQETLSPIFHWLKCLEGGNSFTELTFDFESDSALHSASGMGEKGLVKLLLDSGVNVRKEDLDKRTALHRAAFHGHEEVVEQLLQNGADIQKKDYGGGTPLASAIENGYDVVIKLLLMKGAKVGYDYIPNVSDLHPDPSYWWLTPASLAIAACKWALLPPVGNRWLTPASLAIAVGKWALLPPG
ncbi:MAG: hypothetical protein M1840_008645 [Geoglossum simile]|nr:MAG: hypothetical protein M1840_008645 [Geoglossum simile]